MAWYDALRISGSLCWESTGYQWFPAQTVSDSEFKSFLYC